jgi:hypothetical protein
MARKYHLPASSVKTDQIQEIYKTLETVPNQTQTVLNIRGSNQEGKLQDYKFEAKPDVLTLKLFKALDKEATEDTFVLKLREAIASPLPEGE